MHPTNSYCKTYKGQHQTSSTLNSGPSFTRVVKTAAIALGIFCQVGVVFANQSPQPTNIAEGRNIKFLASECSSFNEFARTVYMTQQTPDSQSTTLTYEPSWSEWLGGLLGAVNNADEFLVQYFLEKYEASDLQSRQIMRFELEEKHGQVDEDATNMHIDFMMEAKKNHIFREEAVMSAVNSGSVPVLKLLINAGYPIDRNHPPSLAYLGGCRDYPDPDLSVTPLNIALRNFIYEGGGTSLQMLEEVLACGPDLNGNYGGDKFKVYDDVNQSSCIRPRRSALEILFHAQKNPVTSYQGLKRYSGVYAVFHAIVNGKSFSRADDKRIMQALELILAQKTLDLKSPSVMSNIIQMVDGELGFNMLEKLILAGASVNCQTKDGVTPLFKAVEANNPSLVEFILKKGVSVSACTPIEPSRNPMCLAIYKGNSRIIKLLEDYA